MIVAIADDLSGAAELAGAASRFGLSAEVHTRFHPETRAEVIAIDADTRSMPQDQAARTTLDIARTVAAINPRWIYKKCDSVLRGNVLAELRAIMSATRTVRAVLISANPERGRVIRGGKLFVLGESLERTAFAHDPEHPRQTAVVAELLGEDFARVLTPDAESGADLDRHASMTIAETLPAGGVEFFESLLRHRVSGGVRREYSTEKASNVSPVLFVCGSAAAWGSGRLEQCRARGVVVETMPDEVAACDVDARTLDAWSARIAAPLQSGQSVMAAIGRTTICAAPLSAVLAGRLASAVAAAVRKSTVQTICAEGGATAAAVARELGWERFTVGGQFAGGAVKLQPIASRAPKFIIKVGSYDWPPEVWER
jgi:uncharacterized protein YgbK (DUF1537 family)